jgi:autophagy-related protein 101
VASGQHFVPRLGFLPCLGVLHLIFWHRYFPSVRPSLFTPSPAPNSSSSSNTALPITLPCILDPPEIDSLIESRTASLIQALASADKTLGGGGGTRGEISVQFFDRKRRRNTGITGGWLGRLGGGNLNTEEEVCWEEWSIEVVVARPRTEAGRCSTACGMNFGRSSKYFQ